LSYIVCPLYPYISVYRLLICLQSPKFIPIVPV